MGQLNESNVVEVMLCDFWSCFIDGVKAATWPGSAGTHAFGALRCSVGSPATLKPPCWREREKCSKSLAVGAFLVLMLDFSVVKPSDESSPQPLSVPVEALDKVH